MDGSWYSGCSHGRRAKGTWASVLVLVSVHRRGGAQRGKPEGDVAGETSDGVTGSVVTHSGIGRHSNSNSRRMTTGPVTPPVSFSCHVTFSLCRRCLCADTNSDADMPLAHRPCEQPLYRPPSMLGHCRSFQPPSLPRQAPMATNRLPHSSLPFPLAPNSLHHLTSPKLTHFATYVIRL